MNMLTDEQKERFALMVEHLPPDEAQAKYEQMVQDCEELVRERRKKQNKEKYANTSHRRRI